MWPASPSTKRQRRTVRKYPLCTLSAFTFESFPDSYVFFYVSIASHVPHTHPRASVLYILPCMQDRERNWDLIPFPSPTSYERPSNYTPFFIMFEAYVHRTDEVLIIRGIYLSYANGDW
ncbi:hypothetical protein A0H81_06604 [Grifola frondosa]|uniref:Uncharacterized protein n=1 Tax=Grifola frondosa TaxID=5627 RepID=A0A1C7M9B5_GRIFR|nr:hypothetical protein A0H81_06604 [Grifola frondosa]